MIYNVVLISGVQQSDSNIPESLKLTQHYKLTILQLKIKI